MLAVAVLLSFSFTSCKKYEDGPSFSLKTKTGRLTGEWEVVTVDGETYSGNESMLMEFKRDGDFIVTWNGGSADSETGIWEWQDQKEIIHIEIDGEVSNWTVTRLTNSEFWFKDDDVKIECEKK